MKKILLAFVSIFLIGSLAFAQIENPVKWNYTAKKIADKTYEIHMTATLDASWHLYAQDAGDGPVSTTFAFSKNPLVKLSGETKENGKLIKEYDNNFNSILKFYANKVDFVQVVTVRTNAKTILKGTVNFMTCNDRKCLPPKTVPFTVNIGS